MTAYGINPPFDGLSRGMGQVGYALLTRAPVVILEEQALPDVTPRLACVKPVASVHPEPGSNSSLYISISLSLNPTFSIPKRNQRSRLFSFRYLLLVLCLQSFQ